MYIVDVNQVTYLFWTIYFYLLFFYFNLFVSI